MEDSRLQTLYQKLCFLSVFKGLKNKAPIAEFFRYCESETATQKYKAYADFVAVIYEKGNGDLTSLLKKALFEDENIFVKSYNRKEELSSQVEKRAEQELKILSKFAGLKTADFAKDMGLGVAEIPEFSSVNADMVACYGERMENIEKVGYGIFSTHASFRFSENGEIEPIVSVDKVSLESFVGYEEERQKIVENTKALLDKKPAVNALLYGDAGTGKSSTVKAVVNAFYGEGLRLIEIRKDQLRFLPRVMQAIHGNPLKFIIFIDDLSFNKSNDDFSMLKAVLEGSASAKTENAVIYATSNRRHIIKESFSDRDGDDVHRNDTLQETLSLSERFGLTVCFSKPDKKLYLTIVEELAKRYGVKVTEALFVQAEAFALKKGNRSPRCAEQFIKSIV